MLRIACRLVRAVPNPEQHGLARGGDAEPAVGPVDDGARDRSVAEKRGAKPALGGVRIGSEGARDDLGEVLVGAGARAIRLEQSREAGVTQEPLCLGRLRFGWLDLDRDAREDGRGREVPPLAEREPRIRMERVGMISLADDPPRVLCRPLGRTRRAPRRRVVEQERQARGFDRRRFGDTEDLFDAPPAFVAVVARRGALGAE